MEFERACPYRMVDDSGMRCRIQSLPSLYSITPAICKGCEIPTDPCQFLKARVLIGESLSGEPTSLVLQASCEKKRLRIDPRDFRECKGCGEYLPMAPLREVESLTGLYRREGFEAELENLTTRNRPLALLLVDIDHFKRVNDELGHPMGDLVLKEVGRLLRQVVGHRGTGYRYGGEELAVILPNFTAVEAQALAERIREMVEAEELGAKGLKVTVSIGIAAFPDQGDTPDSLLAAADRALYRAKEEGRNRVCLYDPNRDIEEELVDFEIDFVGNADITSNSKIRLEEYYLYPSNPRKIRAIKVYDFQRGVYTIGELDPLLGRPPLKEPIEGKAIQVSKGQNRTYFLIKVRKSTIPKELVKSIRK